jgi:hypothetical protein
MKRRHAVRLVAIGAAACALGIVAGIVGAATGGRGQSGTPVDNLGTVTPAADNGGIGNFGATLLPGGSDQPPTTTVYVTRMASPNICHSIEPNTFAGEHVVAAAKVSGQQILVDFPGTPRFHGMNLRYRWTICYVVGANAAIAYGGPPAPGQTRVSPQVNDDRALYLLYRSTALWIVSGLDNSPRFVTQR